MQSGQENTNPPSRLDCSYRRLMAVDDEADITFTLKKELEQSGFSLDVFNDPIVALSNFKADYYDLILLDVQPAWRWQEGYIYGSCTGHYSCSGTMIAN